MRVSVIGATGLVGSTMLTILEERNFPVAELIPVASENSIGKTISFKENKYDIVSIADAVAAIPDIALFSAGGALSLEWAEKFAANGTFVIDNSSAWRMHADKKLIVPEVNGNTLTINDKVIANPNCSTIQMVMVLKPLHDVYKIKRVVVSTYQSVTGSGQKGVNHLLSEREGKELKPFYPHAIDMNVLPHIDVFQDNGYTKEEMKMIQETQKIMGDDSIKVTATAVRVPVMGGHSESVNIEFENEVDINTVKNILNTSSGIVLQDHPFENIYPMPKNAFGKNEVFVGRIRKDDSQPNSINCWIVSDNLRKGAATNAVQIAEYIAQMGWC